MSAIESNYWFCYFSKYVSPLSICYALLYLRFSWLFHCHNSGSQLLTQFWRLLSLINSLEHYHPAVTLAFIFLMTQSGLCAICTSLLPQSCKISTVSAISMPLSCRTSYSQSTFRRFQQCYLLSLFLLKITSETSNKIYFSAKEYEHFRALVTYGFPEGTNNFHCFQYWTREFILLHPDRQCKLIFKRFLLPTVLPSWLKNSYVCWTIWKEITQGCPRGSPLGVG